MSQGSRLPRIGDVLVERGLITHEQLNEALRIQRETVEKIGPILARLGYVEQAAIDKCMIESIISPSVRNGLNELTQNAFEALPAELVFRRLNRTRLITDSLLDMSQTSVADVSITGTAVLRVADQESTPFEFSIDPRTSTATLDQLFAGGLRIWIRKLAASMSVPGGRGPASQ